jgi:hypothetical protein
MRMTLGAATIALLLAACSRDEDARKLLADMATLQEGVQSAMRDSPDDAGIAKAEALVAAQSGPLHARFVDVNGGKLSAGVLLSFNPRCVSNESAAQIGEDYVMNALAKRGADAALKAQVLARTEKMKATLKGICP